MTPILRCLILCFSLWSLVACSSYPPKKISLPPALVEVSGIAFSPDRKLVYAHNDSGDGPVVYSFPFGKKPVVEQQQLAAAAIDWEDISQDNEGKLYLGDFGNNAGRRKTHTIYGYDPTNPKIDTLVFTYPNQDGRGRGTPGNYDCEAMVWQAGYLHLFTKAMAGQRGKYWSYHYRLRTDLRTQEALLLDSLYLPRRVITGAALDAKKGHLLLVAYNYKRVLGFYPATASSHILLYNFPEGRFFQGQQKRRNTSWGWPKQFESIDYYDERYFYIATEKTKGQRQAFMKRKGRFNP